MASNIRIRRSAVPGKVPTVDQVQLGELAVNTYDGKAFIKKDVSGSETIVNIGGGYPGKTYFVTDTGLDTNDGESISSAFATIKHALTLTVAGDTVEISSGTFTEIFPLTVPQGVIVRGKGIRSTIIQPTSETERNDAFLVNGETTIEELTITNFYYNSSADTGYGFRFAPNMVTTTRSPYIIRVTVLTRGSDTSSSDPYGFDTPDNYPTSKVAGRGAFIDGSVVNSATLEPAMLFNEATFITPNQTGLKMTNGARTEWVNCFTYFSSVSVDGFSGSVGVGSSANATLKLSGITTTVSASQVIKYYQSGSPVAIGTVVSVDGAYVTISGKGSGVFNSVGLGSAQDVRIYESDGITQVGTATTILWADYQKFGADMRSIGSASNFGTVGVRGDGPGVQLRLFGYNFGCVGSGKTFTQDPTLTLRENEAIQLNGGRVYFQSVDQAGNFRIGNIFEISQETGAVSLASTSDIAINGTATIQNLDVTGVSTFAGPLEFDSNLYVSGISTFNNNVAISGFTTFSSDSMLGSNLNVAGITTTATFRVTGISTLTGDVQFDNNINVSGIGTINNLRVTGFSTLSGDVNVSNNLNVLGITTTNNFRVTGVSTLTGDTNFTNNVNVSGITTTATFRVTGISTLTGDVELENNLRVSGVSTLTSDVMLSNNLNVAGITTTGNFRVTGISTLTGDTNFTNNVNVSGITTTATFRVTGISTLMGDVQFDNNINVSGIGTINNLKVTGISTLIGDTNFTNNVNVSGITTTATFRVTGISTLTGDVELENNLRVTGVSTFSNPVMVNSDLNVSGITTTGNFRVTGFSTFSGDVNLTNNLNISGITTTGNLRVTGVSTLTGDTNFTNNVNVAGITTTGNFRVTGISTLTGDTQFTNNIKVSGISSLGSFTFGNGAVGVITGPSEIIIDPSAVGDNTGSVRIAGDFYVDGTTTTVNSTTLEIGDITIGIGSTATGSDSLASGGGIVLHGATDKFLTWILSTDSWTSSENFDISSGKVYKVNGSQRLSEQELTVPNAYIAGLSTLGNLNVTGIGSIATLYVNTGYTTTSNVSNLNVNLGIVTHLNATDFSVTGVSTLANVQIGYGNTDLIVFGDARVTGILTVGTASITIDGTTEEIGVGNSTRIHTSGFDIGSSFLHSTGVELVNINASGIITTNALYVSGISTFIGNITANSIEVTGTGINTFARAEITDLYVGVGSISTLNVNTGFTTQATITYGNVTGILTASDVYVSSASSISELSANTGIVTDLTASSYLYSPGITSVTELYVNVGVVTQITVSNASITDIVGTGLTISEINTVNENVSGISTINTLYVNSGYTTTSNVTTLYVNSGITTQATITYGNVTGILTATDVNVSSAATISNATITNLNVGVVSAYTGIVTTWTVGTLSVTPTSVGIKTAEVEIGISSSVIVGIDTSGIEIGDEISANSLPSKTIIVGFPTDILGQINLSNPSTNTGISTEVVTIVRSDNLGQGSISDLSFNVGLGTQLNSLHGNVSGILTATDVNVSSAASISNLKSNIGIVTYLVSSYFSANATSVGITTADVEIGITTTIIDIDATNILIGDEISAVSIPSGTTVSDFPVTVIVSESVTLGITTDIVGITTAGVQIGDDISSDLGDISGALVTAIFTGSVQFSPQSTNGAETTPTVTIQRDRTDQVIISQTTTNSGISTELITVVRSNNAGIGSIRTLYVNSGITTQATITYGNVTGILTATNVNVSSAATITTINSGIITTNIGVSTYFDSSYISINSKSVGIKTAEVQIGISSSVIVGIDTSGIQVGDEISSISLAPQTIIVGFTTDIADEIIISNPSTNTGISTEVVSIVRSNNAGIGSIRTLYVNSGITTQATITYGNVTGILTATNVNVSSAATITTINSGIINSNVGIVTSLVLENLTVVDISDVIVSASATIGVATDRIGISTENVTIFDKIMTTTALIFDPSTEVTEILTDTIVFSPVSVNPGIETVTVDITRSQNTGIASITSLNFNSGIGTYLSVTDANIGVSTFTRIDSDDAYISGITTADTLYSNIGIITHFTSTDSEHIGITTIETLYNNIGFITSLSGTGIYYTGIGSITTLNTDVGFVTSLSGRDISYSGVSTFTTLDVSIGSIDTLTGISVTYTNADITYLNVSGITTSTNFYSSVGFVTFIVGENLEYSGIGSILNLYGLGIGYTAASLEYLENINQVTTGISTIQNLFVNTGVVTTLSGTRATYEYVDTTDLYSSGVGSVSTLKTNVGLVTFVSGENLNYTGVGTIPALYGTDIYYSGIGTVDTLYTNVGFVTTLSGTSIDYSGIGTIQNLFVNTGVVTTISGTNLTYNGIGIITQFKSYETETSGFTTTQSLHVGVGGSLISVVTGIGSVGIGTTFAQEHLHVYGNILYSNELNTGTVRVAITTDGPTTIHEKFSRLEYRSVEYQIQASCSGVGNTGRYQFTKILSTHDGTTAFNVEYATVGTGTDVSSYAVDIDEGLDAGYIRLQATPAQTGITTYIVSFTGFKL